MALVVLDSDDKKSDDDLPWVNEYVEANGTVGDSFLVRKIVRSSKGFIVVTSHFKGFVFKDSAMFGFLNEALSAWVSGNTVNYPLFGIAAKSGKLNLAVDDELTPSVWIYDKKRTYEQKSPEVEESGLTSTPSNPFLPIPPLTTTSGGKGASSGTGMRKMKEP